MARTAVIAGTATAVSGGMARRQQSKAQQAAEAEAYQEQQGQAQYAAQQAPPPPPPPPAAAPAGSTDAKLDQLTKLGELKAQGILTEAEFEAQKAAILGG